MTFNEYIIERGYKKGDFIPSATARQLHQSWLRSLDQPKEEAKIDIPKNLSRGISDLIQRADAGNIPLNPAVVEDAANSLLSGDPDEQKTRYRELASQIETFSSKQLNEKRIPVSFGDQQILQGEDTGTLYERGGRPLSSGTNSIAIFNQVVKDPNLQIQAPAGLTISEGYRGQVQQQQTGVVMNSDEIRKLQQDGMSFKAIPLEGGSFRVTNVSPLPPSQQAKLSVSRDGAVEFTSGTEAQTKEERAAAARKRMEQTSLTLVSDSARNAIPLMEKGLRSGAFMPTIQAAIGKTLGGTEVGQIESELSTIRGTISFDTMKELRAISPSGGGAGTMTEKEWPRFERRLGNLEIGQDPKILMRNLKNVPIVAFEAANGTPEEVEQNFKQKKITAEVYNNYVNEFLELRESLGVGLSGVEGKSETKFTPKFATPDGKLVPYGQQPIPSVSPRAKGIVKKYRD